MVKSLILLFASLVCITSFSAVPKNPYKDYCEVYSKWSDVPKIYVFEQDWNGIDIDQAIKDAINEVSGSTDFKAEFVEDIDDSDIVILTFYAPMTYDNSSWDKKASKKMSEEQKSQLPERYKIRSWLEIPSRSENNLGKTWYMTNSNDEMYRSLIWMNLACLKEPKKDNVFHEVMMHEWLHVAGLDHTNDKYSLMYPNNTECCEGLTAKEIEIVNWLY